MISGYELLHYNNKMNELLEEKEDLEMYLDYEGMAQTEKEYLQSKIAELDIEIADTLEEIEACGGIYEVGTR